LTKRSDDGFTLLEVVVALGLLAGALVALAQVILQAGEASAAASRTTVASMLALEKLEQLRGLAWGYDEGGGPIQDFESDVSTERVADVGGAGIAQSPPGSLSADTPGFVDYHDESGKWLGNGAAVETGTTFVRRWSVTFLDDAPGDALVLQVRVLRRARLHGGEGWELARVGTLKSRRPR
jgi:prepilin-type N-terminal cleavage/methylation domain-containing protein